MVKIIRFFVFVFLITSCNKNKLNDYYLEVNNNELVTEIIEYAHYADSICKGRTYVLRVYCFEINDSTNRYVIESNIDAWGVTNAPFHFKCKIREHEVLFTMLAGIVKKDDWKKRNFFKVKESANLDLIQKYFPEEFEYYLKNGKFPIKNLMYSPKLCYLTFIQDKLVKKEMRKGLPWW